MAQFDTPQVTRAGAALMAKVLAGGGKIEFTFLTIGDAEYTDEQKTDAALQERTALKNQRMSFPFSSVTVKDETNVCLKAVVSNEKVTESFYITEMGLWAKDASDETSAPILYSIITASVGDYLPVYNGSVPSTIEEIWYTTVSNKVTITISANATAYALAEDVGNVGDLTTDDKSSAVAAINEINAYMRKLVSFRYDEEMRQAISMLPMDYADGKLTIPESLGTNSKTDKNTVVLS